MTYLETLQEAVRLQNQVTQLLSEHGEHGLADRSDETAANIAFVIGVNERKQQEQQEALEVLEDECRELRSAFIGVQQHIALLFKYSTEPETTKGLNNVLAVTHKILDTNPLLKHASNSSH